MDDLHIAGADGDLEFVQKAIAAGGNLNKFDDTGKTPLHHAAENGHLEIVKALIGGGAVVNAHDPRVAGDTALGAIAGNCSLAMAQLLVQAGADPTIRGGMQLCALDRAKQRKRGDGPEVYKLLLM